MRKGFLIILLSVTFIVFVLVYIFKQTSTASKEPMLQPGGVQDLSTSNFKTFKSSEVMDFTINIPQDYIITEKQTIVALTSKSGRILISRNGTNFDNLSDYLNFSRDNAPEFKDKSILTINGLESVSGLLQSEKLYFIYVDNFVYSISTTTESLYDDLDQIAQSFRYTP